MQASLIEEVGEDHRNFVHPNVRKPITVSGKEGDDAKHYQEQAVRLAIEEARK